MKPSLDRDSYLLPLIIGLVSAISIIIGMRLQQSLVRDGYNTSSELESDPVTAIYETTEHINSKYYGNPLDSSFSDEVIESIIEQLDPYSHYFKPDQDEFYERYMNGQYAGIGIEFIEYRDTIFCYDVVADSPADKAGIVEGDFIFQIDSASFLGSEANLDSLVSFLRSTDGTMQVSLGVSGSAEVRSLELTPLDINLPLIDDYILSNGTSYVSYVKIHRFYKSVYQDLMQALERHKDASGFAPPYLIIDVRDNPGGVVEETMKILNQLFDEKDVRLLETISRNSVSQVYKTNGRSFLDIDRVVVICNEKSASASEILAGVLQDHNQAVLVGSHTFGKGLIQQNYTLSNNGSINLSIGCLLYTSPSPRDRTRSRMPSSA